MDIGDREIREAVRNYGCCEPPFRDIYNCNHQCRADPQNTIDICQSSVTAAVFPDIYSAVNFT
jgi:hypothetical protein